MALKDQGARFGAISVLNHWTLAFLMIAMLAFGLYLGTLPPGPGSEGLVQIHKSIGVLVFALGLWRVLWRMRYGFPPEVARMPRWQLVAAKAVHVALMIGIVGMPLSGYIGSATGGHEVSFFGLFSLPGLPQSEAVSRVAHGVHTLLGYALVAIVVLHVLAAMKHQVVDKDATLRRMLGWAS